MGEPMNAYQTVDADRDSLDLLQAMDDYIIDMARELGTEDICQSFCPDYLITVGVCHYGCAFPWCRVGRILKEEGIL